MTNMIPLSEYPSIQSHEKKRGVDASILKRGFTLIEMVVTLSIIAILAVVITTQFSSDSAKATRILSNAETIKKAALRFKMDTGEWPCTVDVLVAPGSPAYENPPNLRQCRISGGPAWSGPYLDKGALDDLDNGSFGFPSGLEGVWMILGMYERGYDGAPVSAGFPMVVRLGAVPTSLAMELMKMCTGNAGGNSGWHDLSDSKCSSNSTGDPDFRNFIYLIGFHK